ncbi:precorrin-4/cobalt-precorrin-4 C11-methyltransferase [Clostridiales Family XIII bacterium PM5-7]
MIHFIGAGPGAADLITVRGAKLLQEADVIIYAGSLVNPSLLDYAKESCKIYDSAKMTLEEVIDVMKENKESQIVRLHTGDPCIYGAIREQMDILDREGLAYESVPGVSSFIGAAAALNAEYTLPNVSQTVILTRMAGRTPVPEKEEISKLASHGATMVVFLTSTMLAELSERLIEGGYEPDSPAAIVYKATWPDEKVIRTTVKDIAKAAEENDINKMALIMVGGFLGSEYERSKLYDPSFTHLFREATKS